MQGLQIELFCSFYLLFVHVCVCVFVCWDGCGCLIQPRVCTQFPGDSVSVAGVGLGSGCQTNNLINSTIDTTLPV